MIDSKSAPDRIAGHLRSIPRSGIRDFFELVNQRRDIISLSIGEPDFVAPWSVREAAIFALDRGSTNYTPNMGLLSLRRAIAGYVARAFGLEYDPETEILITVGVSEALDLAIRAVVNPGDEVLYHEPCYVSYRPLIAMAHGVPVEVAVSRANGFRLTRAMLEARVTGRTRVLLLNFPTNPTGATLAAEDMEDIAAFVRAHDLLVVSDEIYSELTYEGERLTIAAYPGMRERTVFLHGFSKAWAMTGFRVGYAAAPPLLTEAMMKIHQYTMLCAPRLSQEAAVEALQTDRDTVMMRDEYRRRRNYIVKALNDIGLPCHKPSGAFYVFPCIEGFGMSSKEFSLRLLEEEKVACVPGSAFGASGEGFLRCSYATEFEQLKIAMERVGNFVERLRVHGRNKPQPAAGVVHGK